MQERAQLQRQVEHVSSEQQASAAKHEQDRAAWQADIRAQQQAASRAEEALRCCQADKSNALARLVASQVCWAPPALHRPYALAHSTRSRPSREPCPLHRHMGG